MWKILQSMLLKLYVVKGPHQYCALSSTHNLSLNCHHVVHNQEVCFHYINKNVYVRNVALSSSSFLTTDQQSSRRSDILIPWRARQHAWKEEGYKAAGQTPRASSQYVALQTTPDEYSWMLYYLRTVYPPATVAPKHRYTGTHAHMHAHRRILRHEHHECGLSWHRAQR